MNITTIRTILVYLIQAEDTCDGEHSPHGSIEKIPEMTLRWLGVLKTCLWACLAVIFSLFISHLS